MESVLYSNRSEKIGHKHSLYSFVLFVVFFLLLSGALLYSTYFVYAPTKFSPIKIYSSTSNDHLKSVVLQALYFAQKEIYLSAYTLNDPHIIKILNEKVQKGLKVSVRYDLKRNPQLTKLLHPNVHLIPIPKMMHEKILIIDGKTLYLGTGNFTRTSLSFDENLLLAVRNSSFAQSLKNTSEIHTPQIFNFYSDKLLEYYQLPFTKDQALERLIDSIRSAKTEIRIWMFCLTHPKIVHALEEASKMGVSIEIVLDRFSISEWSKKIIKRLKDKGVRIYFQTNDRLVHNKCAWIDQTILITGSANWSKSAFESNQDYMLLLHPLDQVDNKKLLKNWKELRKRCISQSNPRSN